MIIINLIFYCREIVKDSGVACSIYYNCFRLNPYLQRRRKGIGIIPVGREKRCRGQMMTQLTWSTSAFWDAAECQPTRPTWLTRNYALFHVRPLSHLNDDGRGAGSGFGGEPNSVSMNYYRSSFRPAWLNNSNKKKDNAIGSLLIFIKTVFSSFNI